MRNSPSYRCLCSVSRTSFTHPKAFEMLSLSDDNDFNPREAELLRRSSFITKQVRELDRETRNDVLAFECVVGVQNLELVDGPENLNNPLPGVDDPDSAHSRPKILFELDHNLDRAVPGAHDFDGKVGDDVPRRRVWERAVSRPTFVRDIRQVGPSLAFWLGEELE